MQLQGYVRKRLHKLTFFVASYDMFDADLLSSKLFVSYKIESPIKIILVRNLKNNKHDSRFLDIMRSAVMGTYMLVFEFLVPHINIFFNSAGMFTKISKDFYWFRLDMHMSVQFDILVSIYMFAL